MRVAFYVTPALTLAARELGPGHRVLRSMIAHRVEMPGCVEVATRTCCVFDGIASPQGPSVDDEQRAVSPRPVDIGVALCHAHFYGATTLSRNLTLTFCALRDCGKQLS